MSQIAFPGELTNNTVTQTYHSQREAPGKKGIRGDPQTILSPPLYKTNAHLIPCPGRGGVAKNTNPPKSNTFGARVFSFWWMGIPEYFVFWVGGRKNCLIRKRNPPESLPRVKKEPVPDVWDRVAGPAARAAAQGEAQVAPERRGLRGPLDGDLWRGTCSDGVKCMCVYVYVCVKRYVCKYICKCV